MTTLYNTGISLYRMLLFLGSFFNKKASQMLVGRQHLFHFLKKAIHKNPGEYIWFHCASLGEFEQGRPIIERIKKNHPRYKIILTFFSPSGYEVRKKYPLADIVCYLPFDTKKNAHEFVSLVKPKAAFFIKYEFWHHFLKTLKDTNTPTYLVSGIFRASQIQFKTYGKFFFKTLTNFKHLFVQDDDSQRILLNHGISQVSVAGDTRFDRVAEIAKESFEIDYITDFGKNNSVMVCGSTWPSDEKLLSPIINEKNPLKFIIAPHEVNESHLKELEAGIHKHFIRYSSIRSTTNLTDVQVIIIDTIGLLSKLYKYSHFTYIGGAFEKGLHNILEPATFGMPLFFGTTYNKFNEAKQLVALGGAFPVKTTADLSQKIDFFLSNREAYSQCASICQNYVRANGGASDKIINYCEQRGDL